MASIEQRLQALESKRLKADKNLIVVFKDGDLTEAQKDQIKEAELIGQDVMVVEFVSSQQSEKGI